VPATHAWVRLVTTGAGSRRALLFWGGLHFVAATVSIANGLWLVDDLAYAAGFSVMFLVLSSAHLPAAVDRSSRAMRRLSDTVLRHDAVATPG
jgi:hypothetical protein